MPLSGDAQPHPKSAQLARGQRRYRRRVASPKQWAAIIAAKLGPCRVCGAQASNGRFHGVVHLHHLVPRAQGGDDVADNLVPICPWDHSLVSRRDPSSLAALRDSLSAEEGAYCQAKLGPDAFARLFGAHP